MNTRFCYLYTDAENYKRHNECVVPGVFTEEMKAVIMNSLHAGEFFIPSQVGLPEKRFAKVTELDHCWFTMDEYSFAETEAEPTVAVTAEELTEAFRSCAGRWDDTAFGWITDEYDEEEEEVEDVTPDYEDLTPEVFRDFLRKLQEDQYGWPNLYFAWEKQDGSLFIVGTKSGQFGQMIVHEVNPNDWINRAHSEYGELLEYSSVLYGISPYCSYVKNNQKYDPVDVLADKVAEYSYLGAWEDPDVVMYNPYAYTNVIACGRWELAVEHICPEKLPELNRERGAIVDQVIHDAKVREALGGAGSKDEKVME